MFCPFQHTEKNNFSPLCLNKDCALYLSNICSIPHIALSLSVLLALLERKYNS